MPYMSPVYFSTFVLASQFVLVNVVVAVLMKQLEDAKELVSPSASRASGLNIDLEDQEKEEGEQNNIDENKTFNENNDGGGGRGNIAMLHFQKKRKLEEDLIEKEEEPLLNIENKVDSFDENLVSLDGTKESDNENDEDRHSWSSIQKNESTNERTVPGLRNNQEPTDGNKKNHKDIENILKDMLEIVVADNNSSGNEDHLEVDLVGTALALSGLRDSVISTCV